MSIPISKDTLHQTLACAPVLFNQFLIGVGSGWTAPTLLKLQGITANQASWMASLHEVGRILGPFVSPLLVDNLGRKNTLVLITILHFLVWTTVMSVSSIYLLYMSRVLYGIANGINDVVSGIYTTENCSPNFRAIIGGVVHIMYVAGIFIEFTLASTLSYFHMALVNFIFTCVAFCALYFGTETPHFLSMKGKHEKAEKNLLWLRGGLDVESHYYELQVIQEHISAEKQKKSENLLRLISSAANMKAIFIVLGISILSPGTGTCVVIPYTPLILSPSQSFTVNQFTMIFGLVQFLCLCASLFIVERFERKTLIVSGFMGLSLCNVCTFVLLYMRNNNYEIEYYAWFLFAFIMSYGGIGSLMSPARYAIGAELLPLSVRAIGGSMGVVINSTSAFVFVKMFFLINQYYGMETNFLIYSIMAIVMSIFVYVNVPETRGKALHEIHQSLKHEAEKCDVQV